MRSMRPRFKTDTYVLCYRVNVSRGVKLTRTCYITKSMHREGLWCVCVKRGRVQARRRSREARVVVWMCLCVPVVCRRSPYRAGGAGPTLEPTVSVRVYVCDGVVCVCVWCYVWCNDSASFRR